ncbi:hypothetical protein [Kiloniella sp.]|uniref:hypothetical protein n=1 Tax=Kiloniella sp. TaxID=1938587 RepID=UPI003B022794
MSNVAGSSPSSPSSRSVLLPAVISALFGSHAMQIGQLIIVAWDLSRGKTPQKIYQVEMGLLVLGIGFLVLLFIGVKKALHSQELKDLEGVAVSIIVGLLGGMFSIIDKTSDASGIPGDRTAVGLFYLVILTCIFVMPVLSISWSKFGLNHIAILMGRLTIASLIAGFLTGLLQLFYRAASGLLSNILYPELFAEGHFQFGRTSFFLSAPMAAMLLAPWALLLIDPLIRPSRWLNKTNSWVQYWVIGYIALAFLMSAMYALGFYYPKHENGWLSLPNTGQITTIVLFLSLHMPGLFFAAFGLYVSRPQEGDHWMQSKDFLLYLGAFCVGLSGATLVSYLIFGTHGMTLIKAILFCVGHGITAMAIVFSVLLAHRIKLKSNFVSP